jgi:exonuclease 3'-5' domain-containing protein 2
MADSSSDAYAAVQLYAVLNHERENLDDVPPVPYHAELNLPIPVILPTPAEEDASLEAATEDSAVVQDLAVLQDELSLPTTITTDSPQPESELSSLPP